MTVAVRLADDSTAAHDAAVLVEAANRLADGALAELLRLLASNLSTGVVVAAADDTVSPAGAGAMLGVSRQYVDKLIARGVLAATTKPGSTHRRIFVADLVLLERERRTSDATVEGLIDDLIDAGVEY